MKRKFTFLIAAAVMLLTMMATTGTMWGQTTYKLQQVTSVEAGGLYVFEQDGYVMNNAVSSSALQTTNSYQTSGLNGTETYVWTLETASNGFYMKNVYLTSNQYINNASSTGMSFGNKSSIWAFNFQTDNTVLIQNNSNSDRFLGYTNATSHAYKAYATSNLSSYPHAIKVYQLVEETGTLTCATPVFSPVAGTYYEAQSVTITSATDGATIYYTLNGNDPTTSSSVYSSAISITETTTVKAMAVKTDYNNSEIASATYTINEPSGETWSLVTSASDLTSGGIYVIACNTQNMVAGDISNSVMQNKSATFSTDNDHITVLPDDAVRLTLGLDGSNYTFANSSNKLLGCTAVKKLAWDSGTTTWSISFANNKMTMSSTGDGYGDMKYNSSSPRFTTYASGQTDIQLYRLEGGTITYSVTYNGNGNTGGTVPTDGTAYESGDVVTVLGNTGNLVKAGYIWAGWNTLASGEGTTYLANETFNISANATLYAKWDAKTITNLTCTGTPTAQQYAGHSFDPTGLTVTATFNDASSENVTASVTWTPNPLTIETTSITGTYMGMTVVVEGITVTYAPGSQENPYTVAQARAAIDAGTGVTGVYATGIVSAIPTAWSTQHNNITFNIVDESGDEDFLQAFRCVSTTSADASTVAVGDIVVVYGNMLLYQSTTYEFAQGCQLISLEHPSTPYFTANDVNITYDATGGSIAYTVENQVQGGQVTAATTSTWLTLSNDFASPIAFTCSANEAGERTATVTLTYTYGAKTTVNKEVTVTQAGNPNVFDNISAITNTDVNYKVKGTVLAVSARAFVLGDGTGYVYYYNGYSAPSVAVNDIKVVDGTMSSYGHVFQFTNAATITEAETSNYNGSPEATIITEIPDYTSGLHLSDYFQFDGTLTKSSGYYYVSCGEGNINISYPSSTQQTAMNALENKDVRVKGYFAGINSSNYFTVILESIEEIVTPTISITPATANSFTYVQGTGPSADQAFEVTGENLTSDNIVATITTGADYFEITDNVVYSNTVTVNSGDYISIRLKAGLELGNEYAGVLTLTNEGAQNVTMNLSGSVTGATYDIVVTQPAEGGTIEADKETAEAGTTITLTATPDAAYNFGSWIVEDENENPIEVTGTNPATFEMPASDVLVTATFTAKETFEITCVADPTEGGEIEASPASAYEGHTVTLSYLAETGYILSGIVITKTEDGSATGITPTASGDDFTFTMPGYAVTATATFLSETYTGSFVKFTGSAMEEGDYILVYNNKAMNNDNTTTSSKLGATDVNTSTNIITNPSRSIVWHIAPIGTDGKWTIHNDYVNKYVNASGSGNTNITLVDNASYSNGAKWSITIDEENNTYDFSSLTTSRALRYYENSDVFGHYATSNSGPFTLYKYTELTERTITFNGNGGLYQGNETYTQTVYDGIAANLTANQFAKANSAFSGWSTTQNGEVEYADGASITVTGNDITLFAQWSTSYTAMADDPIVGGAVLINGEEIVEVAEGTQMTLTYTANPGYAFGAWNVYKADDPTTTVAVENNQFNMPAYDVIVSASFVEVTTYSLVTNVNQIVSGKHYILVGYKSSTEKYYAMGYDRGNNRAAVEVSVEETVYGNYIEQTADVYEFVINTHLNNNNEIEYYTIYDAVTPGYLYAASSGSNYLKTQTTNDANGQWTISIEDNKATILAQGSYSHNKMRFNDSNNPLIFACYLPTNTTGSLPYIYVKDNDIDLEYYGGEVAYPGNSIPDGGSITVGAGSVMTVPDEFFNNDPAVLVIEDGGQLIHENSVNATVQKSVAGASSWGKGVDGWYLIASPVHGAPTSAVTIGQYDLFVYNEPTAYWWVASGHGINTFSHGQGFLYANSANVDLNFAGEMVGTETSVSVDLSYTSSLSDDVSGFNLVGNPFSRNLKEGDVMWNTETNIAYLTMNDERTDFVPANIGERPIKPGEGFFFQAKEEGQQLVFNPTTSKGGNGYIKIVAGNENGSDNAYINIANGNTIRKFNIDNGTKVYVMEDNGDDYAAARVEELAGSMLVNFKAAEDGEYTITVNAKNIEAHTMMLFDDFTGETIDLLETPSYTFTASVNDSETRFKLIFDFNTYTGVGESYTNGNFAYQAGDEILVSGEGTLQVFDVMGRYVASYEVNGSKRISTSLFNTGVYIFKMTGENAMTQKIVVR